MTTDRILVSDELDGIRADRAVAEILRTNGHDVSVREVRHALQSGTIRVEGVRAPGDRVRAGAWVDAASFTARTATRIAPDHELASRVPVVFEDERILVLDKPSGIHTTPIASNPEPTLLGAAVAIAPTVADAGPPFEGGAVHRLDRPTSGVVVFAKDRTTRSALRASFRAHDARKTYAAVVEAPASWIVGTIQRIDEPIRQLGDRVRVGAAPDALEAASEVRVVALANGHALVRVATRFGRRHQVRAHLAHVGAPIVGDVLYGGSARDGVWIALHAGTLEIDGQLFEAPLPEHLVRCTEALGLKR